ncbi:MAG TPA: glycosyltransferase [Verrucomicrobiota bacterium]|nr:hypothetical protein [Verrucomicrobiales bacterium]HRI13202.1 glycosyltransferase [Verrucomicrobiota bacterium]
MMERHISGEAQDSPSILWFSIFDWWTHSHGYSDFQLAMTVARQRKVLLVNSIGMRAPTLGRTTRVGRRIVRKIGSAFRGLRRPVAGLPNFAVFSPFSLPIYGGALARWNAALAADQVRRAARRCNLEDPVGVVSVPTAYQIALKLGLQTVIYKRSDDHAAFSEAGAAVAEAQARMLKECRLVVYASRDLMARERELVGDRAFYLEHGVDLEQFRPDVAPDAEISSLPRPRIGFCGSLRAHALDIELLERLGDRLGDAQLILVGDRSDAINGLLKHRNVRWFAPRPHQAMPSCWSALDVALMPYRAEQWGQGVEPIKLREMLAMGLPVVSTRIPAAMAQCDLVTVADDTEDFISRVLCEAEQVRNRTVRVSRIAGPSWSAQAQQLVACADSFAKSKTNEFDLPSRTRE